jgi:hypothetical protein
MVRYLSATPLVSGPALALIGGSRTTSPGSVGFYASDASGNWTELAYAGGETALIGQGTAMLFLQPTAPVGWTKSTAHDDKAIRIVSGATGGNAGGSSGFSAVFGAVRNTGDAGAAATPTYDGSTAHGTYFDDTPVTPNASGVEGIVANTLSILVDGHHHGLALDLKYVDAIVCTKD